MSLMLAQFNDTGNQRIGPLNSEDNYDGVVRNSTDRWKLSTRERVDWTGDAEPATDEDDDDESGKR
eukprot:3571904-Rhodomonas_salina.1